MLHQTFALGDLAVVLLLVVLEGLLSADNALVLAIMVRHLPPDQQRRALSLGLAMSFVFRFAAILLATQVIKLWWLQGVGAIYLLYLPIKHFIHHSQHGRDVEPKGGTFAQTVVALGIADVAFAIDSVLAAVATVGGKGDKTWVVVLGALLGVILLRYAAALFLRLLEKYPALDHLAYVLVGWVGVKLAFMAAHSLSKLQQWTSVPEMSGLIFWSGMALILLVGVSVAVRSARGEEQHEEGEAAAILDANLQDMPPSANDESKSVEQRPE